MLNNHNQNVLKFKYIMFLSVCLKGFLFSVFMEY